MKKSNISHFSLVCRKLIIEHRRAIITTVCSFLGVCLAFGLWCGYYGTTPNAATSLFYSMAANIVCFVAASKLGFDLLRKEDRISMLMTPASTLDKYMPRFLALVPGMFLLAYIGRLVYFYSMILSNGIINDYWAQYYGLFSRAGELIDKEYYILMMTISSCSFLLIEGIYLLGASLWPKLSFLKSSGLIVALWIIFFTLGFAILEELFDYNAVEWIGDGLVVGWSVTAIIFIAACTLIYFSYRVFKNTMVNKQI